MSKRDNDGCLNSVLNIVGSQGPDGSAKRVEVEVKATVKSNDDRDGGDG